MIGSFSRLRKFCWPKPLNDKTFVRNAECWMIFIRLGNHLNETLVRERRLNLITVFSRLNAGPRINAGIVNKPLRRLFVV